MPLYPEWHVHLSEKQEVTSVEDSYEREAERWADEVLRPPTLAEVPAHGSNGWGHAERRSPLDSLLGGGGRALPCEVRAYFEPRFRHDFSHVRVYTHGIAARSARLMGARAYTVGTDVVMAEGQFAPETAQGRQLLAHELAHVAQKSPRHPGPLIRPRLFVAGGKADVRAFFDLLEPASGFTFERDTADQVTIIASVLNPRSFVLASQLLSIIEDPQRDVELNLGHSQKYTRIGAFPGAPTQARPVGSRERLIQEIRIDHLLALEKGAPGSGVTALAHEMIENYSAHGRAPVDTSSWDAVLTESHEMAIEKENLIATELGHPGGRLTDFEVLVGRAPHRFLRNVRDQEQYFLVLDTTFDDPGKIMSNVRRVPRARISRYSFKIVDLRSDSIPPDGLKIIEQAAADLLNNPTATARVTALISVWDSSIGDPDLPARWAGRVESGLGRQLESIIPNTSNPVWSRITSSADFTSGTTSVLITLDRPDL